VPLSAFDNLLNTIRTGGTPGASARAIIDAMTPAQQRAAGIFVQPDGTVAGFNVVLTKAIQNAAAGKALTTNQQAALGLAFNNIPSADKRRDLLIGLAGGPTGEDYRNLSAAVGPAMRAARDLQRTARQQTRAQRFRQLGVNDPDAKIARLEAAGVSRNAEAKLVALARAGVDNPVAKVERLVAQGVRNPVERLLGQARKEAARKTARKLARAVGAGRTYTTEAGRTVTAATAARNAAKSLAAGKPLTATQQKLVRQANQVEQRVAALKAAGARQVRAKVERLAAAGVRNPAKALASAREAGVRRAATKIATLREAGVRRAAQKVVALEEAGVRRGAQKVARLKAAGVKRPVAKLARLQQAGVARPVQQLVQLETAGVKGPAQKIAALRQAGIQRGVQKLARLKAAGVRRPVAKRNQLQQAGVKRPVQQLVELKQAGVQRPAQRLLAQAAQQPVSSAKVPAQRAALGQQTQQIIRTTDQSLTFKTASGQTRTAGQVAANAARNQAAGR
jgi:hypothetical protein